MNFLDNSTNWLYFPLCFSHLMSLYFLGLKKTSDHIIMQSLVKFWFLLWTFFICLFNTHYLSIQPVYVNRWLHNHLKNVCIVCTFENWDFSEFLSQYLQEINFYRWWTYRFGLTWLMLHVDLPVWPGFLAGEFEMLSCGIPVSMDFFSFSSFIKLL